MDIKFKQIDRTNYMACIKLNLKENQKKFVSTNIFSLVQAAYEPDLYPLAIYNDDTMVGFILYDFDEDLNGWSMSRLMIDEKYQNHGIGNAVLKKFLEFFKAKYGALTLYTSAETDNTVAINLYEKFGFKKVETFTYESDGVVYNEFRMVRDGSSL